MGNTIDLTKICRLQKGDTVFLYRSGNSQKPRGIIAYGKVKDGHVNKIDTDEEYNVILKPFYLFK